jgi:hypothetical protein
VYLFIWNYTVAQRPLSPNSIVYPQKIGPRCRHFCPCFPQYLAWLASLSLASRATLWSIFHNGASDRQAFAVPRMVGPLCEFAARRDDGTRSLAKLAANATVEGRWALRRLAAVAAWLIREACHPGRSVGAASRLPDKPDRRRPAIGSLVASDGSCVRLGKAARQLGFGNPPYRCFCDAKKLYGVGFKIQFSEL